MTVLKTAVKMADLRAGMKASILVVRTDLKLVESLAAMTVHSKAELLVKMTVDSTAGRMAEKLEKG